MALPILVIPGAIVAALLAYVKLHGAYIATRAAMAAAKEYIRTQDADAAAEAAFRAGADAVAHGLVRNFFQGNVFA